MEDKILDIESGRYRLIRGAFCPFAHRPVIARELLGLEDHISMGTVDDVNTEEGWTFANSPNKMDPVLEVTHIRDLYLKTSPDYEGPYSVPVLVDVETKHILQKESSEILRTFLTTFQSLHSTDAPNLYPEGKQKKIDEWNQRIDEKINSGVYQIGFAESQEEYEEASKIFFEMMDILEKRLSTRRYIHGENITETDIYLYPTLVRLDIIYAAIFKANRNKLQDFPNLWAYARDLYQTKGFGSTTEPLSIKRGFTLGTMGERLNSNEIIPVGPDMSQWEKPHGRNKL